jgi:Family of unknown function (DUF6263)
MKKIVILLVICVAGSPLFLGCSKSEKSGAQANSNPNSNANGGSAASGPIDLKIKWQAGKQYDMEMDLDQATDINVPNRPVQQALKMTQGLQYSPVKGLADGGNEVKLEFNRQSIALTQNGKEILNYDTDAKTPVPTNGPAAPVAAAMQTMMGVPLVYTIGADGTVQKIEGLDTLTSRINAAVPSERTRMALQQMFDEDTLKQYGSFSESLPTHPVSVGDSWTSSRDINTQAGVMTVNSTSTFKDWEQHNGHNCAHLVVTGDIKTKSTAASKIGAVVDVQKGTISGDSWFDPELGMFVDINSDQDMKLNITTRNMTLTENLKQNIKMPLVDVTSQ